MSSFEDKVEDFAQKLIEQHGFRFIDGFFCLIPDTDKFPSKEGLFLWGFSQKRMRFETKIEKFHTQARINRMEKMLDVSEKDYKKIFSAIENYLKSLKEIGFKEIGKGVVLFEKTKLYNVQADVSLFEKNLSALKEFELLTLDNPIIKFAEEHNYFKVKNQDKLIWDKEFGRTSSPSVTKASPKTKVVAKPSTSAAKATAAKKVNSAKAPTTAKKVSSAKSTMAKPTTVKKTSSAKATMAKPTTVKKTPSAKATVVKPTTTVKKASSAKAAMAKQTTTVKKTSSTKAVKPTTVKKTSSTKATVAKPTTVKKTSSTKATVAKPTTVKKAPSAKAAMAKPTTVKKAPSAKAASAKPTTVKKTSSAKATTVKPTTVKPTTVKPTTVKKAPSAKVAMAKSTTAKTTPISKAKPSGSLKKARSLQLADKLEELATSKPESTIDREKQKSVWTKQVNNLYKTVQNWLSGFQKNGYITFNIRKTELSEENLGAYNINCLELILVGGHQIIFQPVETNILGSIGRIDIFHRGYNPHKVMLLLHDDNEARWELWKGFRKEEQQLFNGDSLEALLNQWIGS